MTEVNPKVIHRDDVRTLARRGAQLVDVLPRDEYEAVHLIGAQNVPLSTFSRNTADRLKWDRPVIVYSRDGLCDLSARAAWRLSSLGFTQVYRYADGKADWLANGYPVEGSQARQPAAGDLADMDVPTCTCSERVGQVRARVQAGGWNACVVVNDQLVALGLLRRNDLELPDPTWTAEEAMERAPQTLRLNADLQQARQCMQQQHIDSVLITTNDGKLFGLLKLADIQNQD